MCQTILVIDTGSSSMRGVVFDYSGKALFVKAVHYTMNVTADGAAMMDIQIFENALIEISKKCSEWAKDNHVCIRAIALDSQRSSVLPVDDNIKPLSSVYMWYDKRSTSILHQYSAEEIKHVYNLSGMRLTGVSSALKMRWIKENQYDIYKAAYKLIGIHDYLLWVMSGNLVTDAGCACRTALMDIRTTEWSDELLSLFSVEREKLLPITSSGSIIGFTGSSFSNRTGLKSIPVISAGGDQQCCILGQGISSPQILSVNSGSATYIGAPLKSPIFDPRMEVNLSYYCKGMPYVLEASNMGSGTVNQWFNQMFYHNGSVNGDTSVMDDEVSKEPIGSNGVICFPDLAGRGCPNTDPDARGVFAGIGLQNSRASLARALFEGICFDIKDCLKHIVSLGAEIEMIQSTGGLTNFTTFNQMLTDITGMPVIVQKEKETTALGAFISAAVTLEIYSSVEEFLSSHAVPMVRYDPDLENSKIYLAISRKRDALRNTLMQYGSAGADEISGGISKKAAS